MAPTLYYTLASPPVRCAMMTAKEIGLDLELKAVDMSKMEHLSPEFTKLNPQHTLPTLVDGDFVLWDSHAIATYIIQKYAKNDSLYPKDLQTRSKIDQRLHFDGSVLFPTAATIIRSVLLDNATAIVSNDKLKAALEFLEKFLEGGDYMVGNTLTVADLSIAATLQTINEFLPIDAGQFPKLTAYLQRMAKLPYYEEINMKGIRILNGYVQQKLTANKAK